MRFINAYIDWYRNLTPRELFLWFYAPRLLDPFLDGGAHPGHGLHVDLGWIAKQGAWLLFWSIVIEDRVKSLREKRKA